MSEPALTPFDTLNADELAALLQNEKERTILIDVRPYSEYALSHVLCALNVKLSSLLVRRLATKKICVEDLVHEDQRIVYQTKLKSDSPSVVIYSENGEHRDTPFDAKNPMHTIYASLKCSKIKCFLLDGGFANFKSKYSDLLETGEAEEGGSGKGSSIIFIPTTTPVVASPSSKKKVAEFGISEILPFLYIGSQRDAADLSVLRNAGIGYVLNLTPDFPNVHENNPEYPVLYHRIPIKDTWNQNLISRFDDALQFIRRARDSDSKVLVHCMAGISRSAAFTIAFIIQDQKMSLTDAFGFVKSKRSIIAPNLDFMGELQAFERAVFSNASCWMAPCFTITPPRQDQCPLDDEDEAPTPVCATPLHGSSSHHHKGEGDANPQQNVTHPYNPNTHPNTASDDLHLKNGFSKLSLHNNAPQPAEFSKPISA